MDFQLIALIYPQNQRPGTVIGPDVNLSWHAGDAVLSAILPLKIHHIALQSEDHSAGNRRTEPVHHQRLVESDNIRAHHSSRGGPGMTGIRGQRRLIGYS